MKNQLLNSSNEPWFDPEQAEKLAEIGAKLRQTRESKSLCLEKMAVKTMIRAPLLEAIERGNLDQLPEAIYTQRLIERYAKALGLDGTQFANLFPTKPRGKPVEKEKVYLPQKLKAHHLYLVYIFLIIFSIHLVSKSSLVSYLPEENFNSETSTPAEKIEEKEEKNQEEETRLVASSSQNPLENSSQSSSINSLESTYKSQNQDRPITVSVIVQEDSWVEVEIDGKVEFKGILERGTKKTWQAEEQLVFVAGNAGGILVAYNNEQAKQIGEPGAVEELVWKADDPGYQTAEEVKN
jgi:cytoskeletal protein RodZ